MACPGGCIGGGGQPKSRDPMAVLKRMGAVYSIDERSAIRKSHENPAIQAFYSGFMGTPGGPLSHELLHTHYTDRSDDAPAFAVGGAAAAAAEKKAGAKA
jgi:NADH-quinone oxidoreductase subunit G